MAFKDLALWLKCGIVLSTVSFVLEIVDLAVAAIICRDLQPGLICIFPTGLVNYPFYVLFHELRISSVMMVVILSVLGYFIIGAIFGLLITKLRK
jgi:hypothetical protein